MADTMLQTLTPGSLLLVQVRSARGEFKRTETLGALVEGELAIRIEALNPANTEAVVSLAWLGLASLGPPAWQDEVGGLSIGAVSPGAGTLRESPEGLKLDLSGFATTVSSAAALKKIDFREASDRDIGPSPREIFQGGTLSGTIKRGPDVASSWRLVTGSLQLGAPQALPPLVRELSLDAAASAVLRLPEGHQHRQLRIRRRRIKESQNSTNPTGGSWARLLPAAQGTWRKCCIEVVAVDEPPALVAPHLVTTRDVGAVNQELGGMLGVIDIGFVRSDLSAIGGGYTYGGGTANAAVIISDLDAACNPYLLAHELGHVLNLCHPSCATLGFATSEDGTVMMDASPNRPRNTKTNCEGITNDALDTLTERCLSRPDLLPGL